MIDINSMNALAENNAQLELPDKGHAFKELVVCNSWDLEPFDLLKVWP